MRGYSFERTIKLSQYANKYYIQIKMKSSFQKYFNKTLDFNKNP